MHTLLITGASRGVGQALALACAASGNYSKIILNGGSDAAALEETSRLVAKAGIFFVFLPSAMSEIWTMWNPSAGISVPSTSW